MGIIFSVGSEAAPSTGTIQVAFILSQFEDQEYQDSHDQDYFEDLAFGETDSMWEYFDEVSRSELNIEGDVFGPYTLDGDAEDYGTENQNFVRDSVEIADDDIDYREVLSQLLKRDSSRRRLQQHPTSTKRKLTIKKEWWWVSMNTPRMNL